MGRFLFSGFRARSRGRRNAELPRGFDARGSRMAGLPPDLFGWARTVPWREFPTFVVRSRYGGGRVIFCEKMLLEGAGGPVSLRTSSPVRSLSRVDTDPHAALRALLVGLRPPTPQSPERLRSTPFDCVAIAPCCFAERKAVLSHALAALTALNKSASQAVETCARGADRAKQERGQGRKGFISA